MATFNSKDENLEFTCTACITTKIIINPESQEDMMKLGQWLLTHSKNGGTYNCVKIVEKIPVKDRTEAQHQDLIQQHHNGSVRAYLLSMGKFKK